MALDAALADFVARGGPEEQVPRVVGAVIDQGLYVPVREDGDPVLVQQAGDGVPALPGFGSGPDCAVHLPTAAGTVYCDALRLAELIREYGAARLVLFGPDGSTVLLPVETLFEAMAGRGVRGAGQRLRLSRSTHPLARALRSAAARRVRDFPEIHGVWISRARWLDTGAEHLLVHLAVDADPPGSTGHPFLQALLSEPAVTAADDGPMVSALAFDRTTHAGQLADLDRMGLDTIRVDRATGRVEVLPPE
ncbi:hypothetical protein ACIRBX_19285 [Kitasatospora sp. NPDC096147]|uniref:hypothetical protein n=1 Tax=Kitasatospora sp. NPDC096147 TaxID=3364093 RepID=UPI0038266160